MSRENFQIFTPTEVASEMLDKVGYTTNLYGQHILENSCGDGRILEIIVKRYIEDCLNQHMSLRTIKKGLSSDITAYEIDKTTYEQCKERINDVAQDFGIHNVKWQLYNEDYLVSEHMPKYSFIVGNPPYISYLVMSEDNRSCLKERFKSCQKGPSDYCYAFIEASINNLLPNGKMMYLIPSSIFKTRYAKDLRNLMLPHLVEIFDYMSAKVFRDALTSSAIIFIEKNSSDNNIAYYTSKNNEKLTLNKKDLCDKWIFEKHENMQCGKRFGDYFHVAIVIATQANKVFVISDYMDDGDYITTEGFRIEKAVLRKAYSPKGMRKSAEEYILFPYSYNQNNLHRYTEKEFRKQYPEAVRYLEHYRDELDKRKADKKAAWFEYGRSQALAHLNQPKLMLSTVFTNKMKVYFLGRNDIPYSGLYIIPKSELNLQQAKTILESETFERYLCTRGIHVNGNSLRFVAEDVQNYCFE